MNTAVVAYVPVLHEGYRGFFQRHAEATELYVVPREFAESLSSGCAYLKKDLRAMPADLLVSACSAWFPDKQVGILTEQVLVQLNSLGYRVIMPDEDVSREIACQFLGDATVDFDNVFLRWDRGNVLAENVVHAHRAVNPDDMLKEMFGIVEQEARQATNVWRQVGAIAAQDGSVLLAAHNTQVPHSQIAYAEGDARALFKKGLHLQLTTDEHAESVLVGNAARNGIALKGADLFLTTFPCPPCAKLVARAGICRVYYADGYAVLDGERILQDAGIELIFVKLQPAS